MRSDEPPLPVESRARILVMGDSVINGGTLTDQSALATSLLQAELTSDGRTAWVGNVSAGS